VANKIAGSIIVKTGDRPIRGVRYIERQQATVEVWINGVCFPTDVPNAEVGRALVVSTSRTLGLDPESDLQGTGYVSNIAFGAPAAREQCGDCRGYGTIESRDDLRPRAPNRACEACKGEGFV
jgi:hypothetical protein